LCVLPKTRSAQQSMFTGLRTRRRNFHCLHHSACGIAPGSFPAGFSDGSFVQLSASSMGRTYLFACFRCGYCASVAGGTAEGDHFAVQTIACADCKSLHDAVTRVRIPPQPKENPPATAPKFAAVLNRLPPRGARLWLKFKPACPVSPSHRVRPWQQPGKCPRCGFFLEQNAIPFRIWD
jgi:hypothetical protein